MIKHCKSGDARKYVYIKDAKNAILDNKIRSQKEI